MDPPKTAAEFLALPAKTTGGYSFGSAMREIDGRMVRVPVLERQPVAFYVADDIPMQCADEDGEVWRLGRYADGSWFRHQG